MDSLFETVLIGSYKTWVFPETQACSLVGGDEYPSVCGGCDPSTCPSAPSSFECGCSKCTNAVWNTRAGDHTCGDRITWVEQNSPKDRTGACKVVSEEFPETCTCDCGFSPRPPPSNQMCGCESCTDRVQNNLASGHSCRDRINWVASTQRMSEADSCKMVADEFPSICGACHAGHCGSSPKPPTPQPYGATVKAMSYNTEYSGYKDGRLPDFASKIREVQPNIVGVQECQDPNALASGSGYAVLTQTGPQNYILYKANRLQVLNRGFMSIPRDDFSERTITWGK